MVPLLLNLSNDSERIKLVNFCLVLSKIDNQVSSIHVTYINTHSKTNTKSKLDTELTKYKEGEDAKMWLKKKEGNTGKSKSSPNTNLTQVS